MVREKNTVGGGDGPSQRTRSKKARTPPQRTCLVEFVKQDGPPLTDEQKKDAKMEARFKSLIAAGIAEAIPAIIIGAIDALRKGKAVEGEASKNSKSKKVKSKSKSVSRERKRSETESDSESSEDSSYHDSSPSSDDTVDKPKDKKKKNTARSG
jgi:hypothetical protein